MVTMNTRDLHAKVNGREEVIIFPSGGLEILADDGKTLFSVRLEGNELIITGGNMCNHKGNLLDDTFVIKPRSPNCVNLVKVEYVGS